MLASALGDGMKVLLFGPDGQVGRALRATLPAISDVVTAGRDRADFATPGALAAIVAAERPDVVINAAAYTAVDKAETEPELAGRVNAEAPAELAEAAAEIGARFVHYSTDYVFDGTKPAPYEEADATAPLSVYGRTKRDGERGVERAGGNYLVFRTSWVHAPGGNNFIAKMLKLATERDELRVIDDQIGAPTSASLIAEVTAAALGASALRSGVYHLNASGETTWNGYARFAIGEAMRRGLVMRTTPEHVLPVPTSAFPTPARRPLNSRLSTGKLQAALGIEMPDWRRGVLATLEATIGERVG